MNVVIGVQFRRLFIHAKQFGMMKIRYYAGFLFDGSNTLELHDYLGDGLARPLVNSIAADWDQGDHVHVKCCRFPDIRGTQCNGPLATDASAGILMIGRHNLMNELRQYVGRFVVVSVELDGDRRRRV
jgi:hypothetical protein